MNKFPKYFSTWKILFTISRPFIYPIRAIKLILILFCVIPLAISSCTISKEENTKSWLHDSMYLQFVEKPFLSGEEINPKKIAASFNGMITDKSDVHRSVMQAKAGGLTEAELKIVIVNDQPKDTVRLILDTDMMTDCDDLAAMAILHKMADYGEVEILATMVSSSYPKSAPVVNVVNTYYGRPDIPVGAPKKGTGFYTSASVFLDSIASEFPHQLESNDHAPDAVALYRKILASKPDSSVVIATIGYSSNIEQLLKSKPDTISALSGYELAEKKVSVWINMGGNFPVDPAIDNVNFTRDAAAAVYAINNWPGYIIFAGREIGHSIHIGDKLRFTPRDNPVRRSYELHRGRAGRENWDHHTADLTAVLLAVRGLKDYWDIEKDGYIDIQADCSFIWRKKAGARQGYIVQKMNRTELGNIMEELLIAPPTMQD
ncbi:MAG: nucleoside hydrolase [Cyclobacteriaceae bacterium]|nr:nucleoside hydrolase [Cyclobacteriaceae bacterium]